MRAHVKKQTVEDRIEELETQLRKTSFELYELASGKHRFLPGRGKIVVRVLPKDMITAGGILLPDTQQNKPVYESIVVEIWQPWVEEKQVKRNGKMETDFIHHRCPVQVGDRIAFPHHLGVPIGSYLDDKYYRILPMKETPENDPRMEVLGTVDFKGDEVIKNLLRERFSEMKSVTTSGVSLSRGSDVSDCAR